MMDKHKMHTSRLYSDRQCGCGSLMTYDKCNQCDPCDKRKKFVEVPACPQEPDCEPDPCPDGTFNTDCFIVGDTGKNLTQVLKELLACCNGGGGGTPDPFAGFAISCT